MPDKKLPDTLTDPYILLLKQLAMLKFATVKQMMYALGLDPENTSRLTLCQRRLREMASDENRFIRQIKPPTEGARGRPEDVFHLDEKGRKLLLNLGIDASVYKEPSNNILTHYTQISHCMTLCLRFARNHSNVALQKLIHDFDLRKMQLPIQPDLYILFHITLAQLGVIPCGLFIEIDTGTETQEKRIAEKIDLYHQLFSQGVPDALGVEGVVIVFLTTLGEVRVKNLQKAIERKLTSMRLERNGQFFFLGQIKPEMKPDELFTENIMLQPYKEHEKARLLNPAKLLRGQ